VVFDQSALAAVSGRKLRLELCVSFLSPPTDEITTANCLRFSRVFFQDFWDGFISTTCS